VETTLRPTGIDGVGDKPWGTHFCLFYETKEDLFDLLIPFFKAGLENHEFCLWITSPPVSADEARQALRSAILDFDERLGNRQIEIVSHNQWYMTEGRFDGSRAFQRWMDRLEQSLAEGYAGMRLGADAGWLERQDWGSFVDYEAKVDEAFRGLRLMALCAYSLTRCSSADILNVVHHHRFSLGRRKGTWERLEGPELQRARAEIERRNVDLERRVEERTVELAASNDQLRQEIDDRKRAEQALQESRQLLQMVLHTLPVGVAVTNRAGDIVLTNPAAKHIWGEIAVSGRERWANSIGFWHDSGKRIEPEDWPSQRALFQGQTHLNELIDIETFDGHRKTIQNSTAPIRNADGDIIGAVIVNEDVTARVRAESALRKSERILCEAEKLGHTGSWEWDLRNNAVTWSDELYRIFGLEPQKVDVARDAMGLIHPEDRDSIMAAIQNTLTTKEPYSFSYQVHRPDGQVRIVQTRGQVVTDSQGTPLKVFGTTQDVTESKRAEEALRESADRLRHLSHRLLEVQEDERRHLARELHDEFGQLLATITVRLHAAKGLAGEARPLLEECAALLQQAGGQVRNLALQLRPAMLETLGLEGTLRWLAEQHEQQTGVVVQVMGHVNGVSGALATACFRVAQEALTNIMRHARARHVWLELGQTESVMNLIVRDDGVGFDVAGTLKQGGGDGRLGLLGMTERVQILGGRLEIHSQPQHGTEIRVSFPLAEPTPESRLSPPSE
jgi:PAS domain S-box-containing protein